MRTHGFTLLELIFTLAIVAVIVSIGIPSFNNQISQSRTKTAALTLLETIETARSTAVFQNKRIAVLAKDNKWNMGWILFNDANNNGAADHNERVLAENAEPQGVFIKPKSVKNPMTYISFIGTGEGKKIGSDQDGAFLAGTIQICPEQKGEGYALILSRGGRTRVEKIKALDCDTIRK